MLLIPVIDLLGGEVVRGVAGERARYRPAKSMLCGSSAPHDVVRAFLTLHPFSTLYIADLDAIEGRPHQGAVVARLLEQFPHVCFWLDAGFKTPDDVQSWRGSAGLRPVLGSETQSDLESYRALAEALWCAPILSLDFQGDRLLGPSELLERSAEWPQDVIVMTLDRVGVDRGPGFERLRSLQLKAPDKRYYAAGGLRSRADAERLAALGGHGALVASALLDGKITSADIAALNSAAAPGAAAG